MRDVDWVGTRFLFALDHPFREPLEPFPDRLAFQRATVLLQENMQFAPRGDDCSAEKSPMRSSVISRRNATTPRLSQVKPTRKTSSSVDNGREVRVSADRSRGRRKGMRRSGHVGSRRRMGDQLSPRSVAPDASRRWPSWKPQWRQRLRFLFHPPR